MCRLFLQSKSTYHVLLAVLCREIEWCKGNCVVVIYENTARLSTLRQGGRVKKRSEFEDTWNKRHSCVPKTPLATGSLQAACLQSLREHPNRWHRASSLPFSTCLILSEEESWLCNSQYPSFPTTRFLPLNQRIMHLQRVTETSASSITTITLHTRESAATPSWPTSFLSFTIPDRSSATHLRAPNGRCPDVVFAGALAVKRTLRTSLVYVERPLCVRGHEIIVFGKHMNRWG